MLPEQQQKAAPPPAAEGKQKSFAVQVQDIIEEVRQGFKLLKFKLSNVAGNHAAIGKKHLAEGKTGDAVFRFKIVTKFRPEEADGWAWLARAYAVSGNKLKATYALNQAKRLQPDYPDLDKIHQMIKASAATTDHE